MAHSSDRNLLFGVLALQLDLIDKEQLIDGLNSWGIGWRYRFNTFCSRISGCPVIRRHLVLSPGCDLS